MLRRGRVIPFPGAPPSPPGRPLRTLAGEAWGLVEVYRGPQAEAVVVKSFLESEGIPALLRSRLAQAVYPFSVGHQGEATILVPEQEAALSRRLLARSGRGWH